jgi:hypothetical protein
VSSGVSDKNAWVELFQESHFCGRRLALRGTQNMTQTNFDQVRAQKKGFEDKAFSARFQLPKNTKCVLYEHKNFKNKLPLEFEGTGHVSELPALSDKVEGKISSMKFVA